jgi:hypothetical protein
MVRHITRIHMPMVMKGCAAHHTRGMRGCGGSVLLDGGQGGAGAGSSYSSIDDYITTTNRSPFTQSRGRGLGGTDREALNKKIQSLMVKPVKKSKNINFSL